MNSERPRIDQVNLVVGDIDATVAFYRRVGLSVTDSGDDWPPGSGARHVEVDTVVADPDGNDVGLMSPKDASKRFTRDA